MQKQIVLIVIFIVCLIGYAMSRAGNLNPYYEWVLMMIGINIILTLSLNLVNGFMGEFSVGHAGFMAIGAYTSSWLSLHFLPPALFIMAVFSGGLTAFLAGILIACLSFKTRGDYLAILTLAFLMIVKSGLENIQTIGGARGLSGIPHLTTLPWIGFWLIITYVVLDHLLNSRFGRHIIAIREDELAAQLMGVNTRQAKVLAFGLSAFFTGIAGGLYAHLLQFINPAMFNLAKSTDMLIMVYLGGAGSLIGSILGGSLYTVLIELLRPLETWRMIIMPLILIILMIFRPQGLMGYHELSLAWLKLQYQQWRRQKTG